MSKEATLVDLKNYFDLSTKDFMVEWKKLNTDERTELKNELGKVLYPEE